MYAYLSSFIMWLSSSLLCLCVIYFFFFKQKTAYEMRISDWSSDVCSSDLSVMKRSRWSGSPRSTRVTHVPHMPCSHDTGISMPFAARISSTVRSEEHTSELQSLMRISYAVFCLKKKKQNTQQPHISIKVSRKQTKLLASIIVQRARKA